MGEDSPQDGLASRIARLVHAHFDALPARSKPIVRDDGTREWIPMAGMVVVRGDNTAQEELTCVAVTSGAKCLAASQLPNCKGLVLHDWHAEVLALRAFNYWVLSEVRGLLLGEDVAATTQSSSPSPPPSRFIRRRSPQQQQQQHPDQPPFELQPDLKVYMCCTCAPCGDASMELTMAAQEDPTPWVEDPSPSKPGSLSGPLPAPEEPKLIQTTPPSTAALSSTPNPPHTTTTVAITPPTTNPSSSAPTKPPPTNLLDGRGHFSKLGIVRRKPARADADSTKSKSCSDKLALRQVSSLLSPETALLVRVTASAYLAGVVLPETEISEVGCERAFGRAGRMKGLVGGYLAPASSSSSGRLKVKEEEQRENETQEDRQDGDASGYRFHPFEILSIPAALADSLWQYGKPRDSPQTAAAATSTPKFKPGTISAVWVAAPSVGADRLVVLGPASGAKQLPQLAGSRTGLYESIIGGVKQGSKASAPVVRGASALSRARMWATFREVVLDLQSWQDGRRGKHDDGRLSQVDNERFRPIVEAATYVDFKTAIATSTKPGQARARALREAKTVLVPWVPNAGDGDWGLDVLVDANPKKRKR